MHKTRVKICGITSVADACDAVAAGADAIGLVFYEKSPRFVSIGSARDIVNAVGPFVQTVGLFVNSQAAKVEQAIRETGIGLLQFHGDEDENFCRSFSRPYIKAIRMQADIDPDVVASQFGSAQGLLFDAYCEDRYGGTGKSFDWQRLPQEPGYPLILAGGLTPDNVRKAVTTLKPYAVDVSGGVESSPGAKSSTLVKQFIENAKAGDFP